MIIVEFFSETMIENMVSALANTPSRVILVGDYKKMKRCEQDFNSFLETIGNRATTLEYRGVKTHELPEIVRTIEEIVRDYPNCHFDLTGGDELTMVAIGVIYERYRQQGVELHQYNIRTGKVYDCDLNGKVVSAEIPSITVGQYLTLYGGRVVYDEEKNGRTQNWQMDRSFIQDITNMWDICKRDCGAWNIQISMLGAILCKEAIESDDSLTFRVNTAELPSGFGSQGIFRRLEEKGLINHVVRDAEQFGFTFKNRWVKSVLLKAGTILELIVFLAAGKVEDKDGKLWYTDRMTGVYIDWDGIIHGIDDESVDTENEIDVLLMHGTIPVFISCKNGNVEVDELYKLNTVANRFGGKYAKKVIAATTLGKGALNKKYFLDRAREMRITVIDGIHEMSEDKLRKRLKALT